MATISSATPQIPHSQVVVVLEGEPISHTSGVKYKRIWWAEPRHRVLVHDNEAWGQRRSNGAIRAYLYQPPRPQPVLAVGSLGLTMEFAGTIANAPGTILMDSGAGESFLDARFARTHGIVFQPAEGTITMGDNRPASIVGECRVKVMIQGYSQSIKLRVTNLIDGVDAILGEPWLKRHGVHLDYEHAVVRVKRRHNMVTLYPCMQPKLASDKIPVPLSAMQLKRKMRKGAAVFLGVLQKVPDENTIVSSEVADILAEYADVFQPPPDGLPPDRGVTHTIPLEPRTVPPFRPMYRLSHAEHAEAKKQITEYLAKGWIEP